jgi:hypothetical protein
MEAHISFPLECPLIAALFLRLRCVAKSAPSRIEATVRTPPTMAHVLLVFVRTVQASYIRNVAYDVKKCAKDWRVSRWVTRMGEIS